jgi:hypothetical protein
MALAAAPAALQAQGLVAIQNYSSDFRTEQPFQITTSVNSGYDTLDYKANPLMGSFDSWFVQGGIGAMYTRPDRTTPLSFSLDAGVVHYIDGMPRFDDTFYNARAAVNFEHRFSERLRISNNLFFTYGVEPNNGFGFGGSTTLWNGQYFYGYNNFNVSYAWTPRLSTTTSYTIDGTHYEDAIVGAAEDRYAHLFAQQFAYALNKQTSLTAEYRYRMTIFDKTPSKNFNSHFALVGVDQLAPQCGVEALIQTVQLALMLRCADRADDGADQSGKILCCFVSGEVHSRLPLNDSGAGPKLPSR